MSDNVNRFNDDLSFNPSYLAEPSPVLDASFKTHVLAIGAMIISEVAVMYPIMGLTELLCAGVYLLTGWAWLAFAVWFIGMVISIAVGMYVGSAMARYVYNRRFKSDMAALKAKSNEMLGSFGTRARKAKDAVAEKLSKLPTLHEVVS